MTVPVEQSVKGLFIACFTIWVLGAVALREYHCSVLAIGLHVLPGNPDLNPIERLWDVLEQDMKDHHTASINLTELWTALANNRQVIRMEHFQKLVESIPRHVQPLSRSEEAQLITR
ncbi:hypothetical protein TNCV_3133841 [Trichonephila clavipes]|nr:hypothetical protein TNCV_3133841 [Trichonephila clavipes]